jgi:hypothetical protein
MNTVLGVLGIITTVLVTFSTHFDFNGLSESHRVGFTGTGSRGPYWLSSSWCVAHTPYLGCHSQVCHIDNMDHTACHQLVSRLQNNVQRCEN